MEAGGDHVRSLSRADEVEAGTWKETPHAHGSPHTRFVYSVTSSPASQLVFTVTSGALPTGVNLATSGAFSGTALNVTSNDHLHHHCNLYGQKDRTLVSVERERDRPSSHATVCHEA